MQNKFRKISLASHKEHTQKKEGVFMHGNAIRTAVLCTALTIGIMLGTNAEPTDTAHSLAVRSIATTQQEFQQDLDKINSTSKSKDVDKLAQIAAKVQKKWEQRNQQYYFGLMWSIVREFTSNDFGINSEDKKYMLARKYTRIALEKADQMPLELETQFLLYIINESEHFKKGIPEEVINNEELIDQRSDNTKLLLHAWKRIAQEIDKNYVPDDPENAFYLNIAPRPKTLPPLDEIPMSGIAPESIKNPETRKAYEAALAENGRKAIKSSEQNSLRQINQHFLPVAERYLINVYSLPPYNTEELKQYLHLYLRDEAVENKILNEVIEAIQHNKKNDKDNNSSNGVTPKKTK